MLNKINKYIKNNLLDYSEVVHNFVTISLISFLKIICNKIILQTDFSAIKPQNLTKINKDKRNI